MVSRIKRIISRPAVPATDAPAPARNRVDPSILLSQVRAGLSVLEETEVDLCRREQELLVEASALYEQLKVTSLELAGIRQQLAIATENADKLQAAIHLLETRRSDPHQINLGEPARTEILVVQPQES